MRVIPRSEWASRSVSLPNISTPTAHLFIHHTADAGPGGGASASLSSERQYMNVIERFHMDSRGWRAIAYSFVVMPSGRIYEGRGWGKAGGHTMNWNTVSHAICFAGNFQTQTPTLAALSAARWLIAEGKKRGSLTQNVNIRGHRDVGATACPGDRLYVQLATIRRPWDGGKDDDDMTDDDRKRLREVWNALAGVGMETQEVDDPEKVNFRAAGRQLVRLVRQAQGDGGDHTHVTGPPR